MCLSSNRWQFFFRLSVCSSAVFYIIQNRPISYFLTKISRHSICCFSIPYTKRTQKWAAFPPIKMPNLNRIPKLVHLETSLLFSNPIYQNFNILIRYQANGCRIMITRNELKQVCLRRSQWRSVRSRSLSAALF